MSPRMLIFHVELTCYREASPDFFEVTTRRATIIAPNEHYVRAWAASQEAPRISIRSIAVDGHVDAIIGVESSWQFKRPV